MIKKKGKSEPTNLPEKKVAQYSGKGIPPEIENALTARWNCRNLKALRQTRFSEILQELNAVVKKKYESNPDYENYLLPPNNKNLFIDEKSLHRYFAGDAIRSDKLSVLKCFLDYPIDTLTPLRPVNKQKPDKNYDYLTGAWYSYIYDASEKSSHKVKRTVLFISHRSSSHFYVQYKGLRGRYDGPAEVVKNTLIFTIHNNDNNVRMFLCTELPESGFHNENQDLILNAGCLSNSLAGHPVSSNAVLVKNNKANIAFDTPEAVSIYLNIKPVILYYSLTDEKIKLGVNERMASDHEKEIITYLSMHKGRNERLKSFSPNSFEELAERNADTAVREGLDNYERLKLKLNHHVCLAFNRFRQQQAEVALFSYTFAFRDEERRCFVQRHPIGNPNKTEFTGEAFLEGEKIFMILRDRNMQRRKQLIAPSNCPVDETSHVFVMNGITSSVSTLNSKAMALRELLVCIPDERSDSLLAEANINPEDRTNGYITYEKFMAIPATLLKPFEKLFLANSSASTLTIPSKTDASFLYYRQDKARKYSGEYHLFTYPLSGTADLLHMILIIDELAQVTLQVRYGNTDTFDTYTYYGVCEYYNNSLHISTHLSSNFPNDERHSEFIFDPLVEKNRQLPQLLTGINLTTDDENKALAVRFIAVKQDWLLHAEVHLQQTKRGANKKAYESWFGKIKKEAGLVSAEGLQLLAGLLPRDHPAEQLKTFLKS